MSVSTRQPWSPVSIIGNGAVHVCRSRDRWSLDERRDDRRRGELSRSSAESKSPRRSIATARANQLELTTTQDTRWEQFVNAGIFVSTRRGISRTNTVLVPAICGTTGGNYGATAQDFGPFQAVAVPVVMKRSTMAAIITGSVR